MGKLITQIALFRRGVKKFEEKVNKHLAEGWTVQKVSIEKRGFKIICFAHLLSKEEK